ncbi:MAG: hypothetical protein FJ012_06455 [Chloroflexi bacterium]|nr:hypothetical protein [Chloroflexota bacterium]
MSTGFSVFAIRPPEAGEAISRGGAPLPRDCHARLRRIRMTPTDVVTLTLPEEKEKGLMLRSTREERV